MSEGQKPLASAPIVSHRSLLLSLPSASSEFPESFLRCVQYMAWHASPSLPAGRNGDTAPYYCIARIIRRAADLPYD